MSIMKFVTTVLIGVKMKIGITVDCLNDNFTGVSNYTYSLIEHLSHQDKNRNSLHLINYEKNQFFNQLNNIEINNPFKVLKTYGWYPYLIRKLRKCDLDIIHNPSQIPTYIKANQKYILTVHDLTPFIVPSESKFGRSTIYKILFPRTLKNADKIIAVSHNTKKDLINYFKIPDDKIRVIHLAANEKFKPLGNQEIRTFRDKYGLNFPFILYVGTLEGRKNIPFLIKSFFELRSKYKDVKLVIAGKKGWKYKNVFSTIEELNLNNEIIFTGYVPEEDLPGLYNAATLFVYPSLYEGFGLPPLEAMACGCPVITSNTSSLPEVVGGAGIMVDPHDFKELASVMHEILNNTILRENLTKKGLERSKLFSWEKCARETNEVYKEVYLMPDELE